MKRYLPMLVLPLLLITCKDSNINRAIIGRWSLVASLDSTGKFNSLIPLVPVVIEFRSNGITDHVNLAGKPQQFCCAPVRYSYQPMDCPINASCSGVSTITYTDWVRCNTTTCVLPKTEAVVDLTDSYLDILYRNQAGTLRYQRVN